MSADEEPTPSAGLSAGAPSRPSKRWRKALVTLAVAFIVVYAVTARLFIWPAQGMPSRVDAIVMLDSPGFPLRFAVRLASQHRARFLVVSQGIPVSRDPCPRQYQG